MTKAAARLEAALQLSIRMQAPCDVLRLAVLALDIHTVPKQNRRTPRVQLTGAGL